MSALTALFWAVMLARDALNLNQFPCEGRGPAPD